MVKKKNNGHFPTILSSPSPFLALALALSLSLPFYLSPF